MKLQISIYGLVMFFVLNLSSCATYNQKKFDKQTEKNNLMVINNIQNIYTNEYIDKIKNVNSIFTIDEIKLLSSTELLDKYYEVCKSDEKKDNIAYLNINKEINKFCIFIEKIRDKIDVEIGKTTYNTSKYSFCFDYNNIPKEIEENIYNSLNILNNKEYSVEQAGYGYEENLYNKSLKENKKYQNNVNLIIKKEEYIEKLKKDIENSTVYFTSNFYKQDPHYMPNNLKNLITGTQGMKVLQVVKGGILAYQDIPSFRYSIYDHSLGTWNQVCLGHKGAEYPIIFIKTTKDFIVGQTIDEVIKYTGKSITYTTYLDSTNTVMVFDSISNDKKISMKEKQIEKFQQEIEKIKEQQTEIENNIKKDFYFYE